MHSNFIISLDFELIWGMHTGDIVNNSYNKNIKGGREAITDLLNLFEKYGIRATWAVVGLMFAENVEEGEWRVSIRSKGIAINGIAAKYGGGGHDQASGAKLKSIEELDSLIKDLDDLLIK